MTSKGSDITGFVNTTMKLAMPHADINLDNSMKGYDALAECLIIISELGSCNHEMQDQCNMCNEKIESHGFNAQSWASYRNWMAARFPGRFELPVSKPNIQESTRIFMSFMRNKLPVFNRQTGDFMGYFDVSTQKLDTPSPTIEKAACWVYENCKFAHVS